MVGIIFLLEAVLGILVVYWVFTSSVLYMLLYVLALLVILAVFVICFMFRREGKAFMYAGIIAAAILAILVYLPFRPIDYSQYQNVYAGSHSATSASAAVSAPAASTFELAETSSLAATSESASAASSAVPPTAGSVPRAQKSGKAITLSPQDYDDPEDYADDVAAAGGNYDEAYAQWEREVA